MNIVIVPAYNAANYIEDCLASLVDSPEVDRVVVSDDGSTDNTKDVVLACHEKGGRNRIIHYIRERQHLNQYVAKNNALKYVFMQFEPEFISFQDADDIAINKRFAKQKQALLADHSIWAVGAACHNMNSRGESISGDWKTPAWPMHPNPLTEGQRTMGIGLWNATAMYRREVFDVLGGFDYTPTMGDTDFFVRLVWATVLKNKKIRNITEPLIGRRLHKEQVSHRVGSQKSVYRSAYQALLKSRFTFFKTLNALGKLEEGHLRIAL